MKMYFRGTSAWTKKLLKIKMKTMQGPQGVVAHKTRVSIKMLELMLKKVQQNLEDAHVLLAKIHQRSLLTLPNENLHATIWSYCVNFKAVVATATKINVDFTTEYFSPEKYFYEYRKGLPMWVITGILKKDLRLLLDEGPPQKNLLYNDLLAGWQVQFLNYTQLACTFDGLAGNFSQLASPFDRVLSPYTVPCIIICYKIWTFILWYIIVWL